MYSKASIGAVLLLSKGTSTSAIEDLHYPEAFFDTAHIVGIEQTLIVSYENEEDLPGIEEVAKKHPGSRMKGAQRYSKPRRARGAAGKGKGSGGRTASGGGGRGRNGGSRGRGRGKDGRSLEEEGDDVATIGFAVIETLASDTDIEIDELSNLPGVASIERAHEVTIDDMNLRGGGGLGPSRHIREIMESINMGQDKLLHSFQNPQDEFEGDFYEGNELETHHRNLASYSNDNSGLETIPFGIDMVNVTHLWDIEPVLDRVKICVIDTGYDLGHEDLPNNVTVEHGGVTGWNNVEESQGVWNIDGHSHGTHCAGTIGAIGNNDKGVIGVNPNPSRFSFHIGKGLSDSGSGSSTDVLAAVSDCVDNGAHVISMSLGGGGHSTIAENVYDDAYDKGVLIIAAAGNSGSDGYHYPASYHVVMSVASLTSSSKLSSFSTRNDQNEISGPGSSVFSTTPNNTYASKSGTSMACPHVAGVAALLISHFPNCTNNQIRNAMIRTATLSDDTGGNDSPGWDKYYGWGMVNAGLAYELLNGSEGCEAGGAFPAENQALSAMAQGGKDQKQIGCLIDEHCSDANMCLGVQLCNVTSNTCYVQENTVPDCDDGVKCTIDTCDVSLYDPQVGIQSMCVHSSKNDKSLWGGKNWCDDLDLCNGVKSCHEDTGECTEDVAPVDCDDSNECTIDTCITTTGLCTHTEKNCDDRNPCTKDDYCDTQIGCVIAEPDEECCGNFVCETGIGEDMNTCARDCSTSIGTPMDDSSPRNGTNDDRTGGLPWFDKGGTQFFVHSKDVPMSITGVDFNCNLEPGDVEGTLSVYTRKGDHFYRDAPDDMGWVWSGKFNWKKVTRKVNYSCAGEGQKSSVYFEKPIHMEANSKQAIMISMYHPDPNKAATTRLIRWNTCDGGGIMWDYTSDAYLTIHAGSGMNTPAWSNPCSISSPFVYSGDIHYVPNVNHTEPEPTPVTTLPRPAVADPQDELPVCTSTPLPQTNDTFKLSNPKRGSSAASAYGYMFDLVSKNPSQSIHISSFDLYFKVESCDYKLWSKKGNSNTDPSNTNWFPLWMEPDYWCLIGEGRLTQQGGNPTWGDRTPMVSGEHFVGQTIEPGQSRAFYVNFFNCSSNWPLAVDRGSAYGEVVKELDENVAETDITIEDDNLALLQGIKKGEITSDDPVTWANQESTWGGLWYSPDWSSYSYTMRGGSVTYVLGEATSSGGDPDPSTTTSATTTQEATTTTEATEAVITTTTAATPTTSSPSLSPTTPSPTLSPTTENPTLSPSTKPTDSPSESPTTNEPTTGAPTPFVPEVVSFTAPPTNSCSIKYAAYFQVKAGDKWTKMTDVAITSYGVRAMQVYVKRGEAEPYEKTPCAWELVAETDDSYNPGYWKRNIYPDWKDGFKPTIIAPNETISVYMINVGSSYGFCMKSQWRGERYTKTWQQLSADSPVGAVSISWGNDAAKHDHFKPGTYYAVANYGGVKLETMKPETETHEPTPAPVDPSTPKDTARSDVIPTENAFGYEFDITNTNSDDKDLMITSLELPMVASEEVDVYVRGGTHEGSSSSCLNWNNGCNQWTNLVARKYVSSSGGVYKTPSFVSVVPAGETKAFVVVTGKAIFEGTSDTTVLTDANGDVEVKPATALTDFYGDNVQSEHDLTGSLANKVFNIKVNYEVVNRICAIQNKKPWVVLDPSASASSMNLGDDGEAVDIEEYVEWHPTLGGDDGLVDQDFTQGPPLEYIE